jgi:hypothetical protein
VLPSVQPRDEKRRRQRRRRVRPTMPP